MGRARRLTRGTLDDAVLRIGVRPSRLPGVLAGLDTRGVTAGLGTGVATVALPADPVAVAAAHAAVHAAGGTSVLRSRPVGLTRRRGARHRPPSPCSAPSSRSSTPQAGSGPAGSPWLP